MSPEERAAVASLADCRVLKESARGQGNVLLLFGEGDDARVLKLYRERSGAVRERLSDLAHRVFERKRGATAAARCANELETMALWEQHGFDVFRRLDAPLPAGLPPPAQWFEYAPGKTLKKCIRHGDLGSEGERQTLRRLAARACERHALARRLDEPRLAHEHATLNHVLVHGERLVTFDFEGGFAAGFPVTEALAQELAGTVRSLRQCAGERFTELLGAFAAGYEDRDLLRELATWSVEGGGATRAVRRLWDRRREARDSKVRAMRALLDVLDR